jgi:hypothetical protein
LTIEVPHFENKVESELESFEDNQVGHLELVLDRRNLEKSRSTLNSKKY